MHPSQPEFSYISILPSFCPSFGFTPRVLRYGGHHWHDRARPLWTFRRLLVPFHVPCWQVDHGRDLDLFCISNIINLQSSIIITHEKNGWFCSQKNNSCWVKITVLRNLDRAKEPQVFRCAMHHWGQDSVFFQMTSEKCIKSADCISGSNQFISIWSILFVCFYSFYSGLSCIFFSILGEGPKTFPTVPDCPFDSDHEHFPWNLQQQQEVSQVPKVVIFGAIHVDLCRD